MRHGQQVVVGDAAADSWLGVEEPPRVVSWDGDANVVVGRRQTLLDTQELINIQRGKKESPGLAYTDSLSVDHQVDVVVDFAIFVV